MEGPPWASVEVAKLSPAHVGHPAAPQCERGLVCLVKYLHLDRYTRPPASPGEQRREHRRSAHLDSGIDQARHLAKTARVSVRVGERGADTGREARAEAPHERAARARSGSAA